MIYKSKEKRQVSDEKLVAGIEKHFAKSTSVVLKGGTHTVGEILAMLMARIAAGEPVAKAKSEWQALAAAERKVVDDTESVVDAFRDYLLTITDDSKLADYGIVVHKRRELTSEEMAAKVRKARATRKARREAAPATAATAEPAPTTANGGQ